MSSLPPSWVWLTALSMVAFAANSLLTRAALAGATIDAVSFTLLRLTSGAVVLAVLARGRSAVKAGSWVSALALVGYAALFSVAYARIGAGLGALVLFGAVQLTMIGWDVVHGAWPSPIGGLGIVLATLGLLGATLPATGTVDVDPFGVALMGGAGIAWGIYSLRGRRVARALAATAGNFVLGVPVAAGLWLLNRTPAHVTPAGAALAVASGALASGLGYALWYAVVPQLGATRAAVVQLSVPLIAAGGGLVWLTEPITTRWLVSAAATLSGVAVVSVAPGRSPKDPDSTLRPDPRSHQVRR